MYLTWSGWGWLALPAVFVTLIVLYAVFDAGVSGQHYGTGIGFGLAFTLAGVGLWALGRRLNKGRRHPDVPHSFFSFPMEWYGMALGAAGVLLAAATLVAPR